MDYVIEVFNACTWFEQGGLPGILAEDRVASSAFPGPLFRIESHHGLHGKFP
jgi:hypothetical protein